MIEFGNDIPPPVSKAEKYGLKKLAVGEFVFLRGQRGSGDAVKAAHAFGQQSKRKFRSRADADGVRIWRIA